VDTIVGDVAGAPGAPASARARTHGSVGSSSRSPANPQGVPRQWRGSGRSRAACGGRVRQVCAGRAAGRTTPAATAD
jgi:hypothetical protein